MAGSLLFSGDDIYKKVKVLSGGEKTRVALGQILLQKKPLLLMDEPTNHMDMESIESLNTALDKYKGTLFFVSHDREFVSSIATRILEIKEDGIVDEDSGYYLGFANIGTTLSYKKWSFPLTISIPIINEMNGTQNDSGYRFRIGIIRSL